MGFVVRKWGRVREPTNMRNLRLVKCFKPLQSLNFRQNIRFINRA
jgi:hypothetical protein